MQGCALMVDRRAVIGLTGKSMLKSPCSVEVLRPEVIEMYTKSRKNQNDFAHNALFDVFRFANALGFRHI